MEKISPFLHALKNYDKFRFKHDLAAGLVVGVMLIPQGMAYAMIAGLPPVYGLYAAIFPSLMYTFFGSSRHVSVGPVAMDSLILFAGVSAIAEVGSENYLAIVVVLTALVGIIQLAMGTLRLGFLANFLSKPVILGFTFAAAVIISIKQIKYLLKIDVGSINHFYDELVFYVQHLDQMHPSTVLISSIALVALFISKRIFGRFPMSLVLVILGTFLSYVIGFDRFGIDLVGVLPEGLPALSVPEWNDFPLRRIWPLAFTLALMGFVEIYSIGQRLQSKHKGEYEINANQDLIGIGLGNLVGSFFGSFPTTAGFSRSAVNESAGAQTGVASLISVLVIVLSLLFLMPIFRFLPEALLGAIIFVAVLGLIDVKQAKSILKSDKYDFVMLLASFAGTLILGIEWGIGVGILLSLVVLIYKTSNPHMAVLGRVEGTSYFRNLDRFDSAINDPEVSIIRFDARLYFANIGSLRSKMEEQLKAKPALKKFVLDAQSISDIDSSGLEGLSDMIGILDDRNIAFHMVNIIGPVRDKLFVSGLVDKVGLNRIHDSIEEAISDQPDKTTLTYQTNIRS